MSAAAILIANQQSEIQHATGNAGAGVRHRHPPARGRSPVRRWPSSPSEADGVRLSRRGARRAVGAAALVAVLAAVALHAPISRGWDQFTHSGKPEWLHRSLHLARRRPVRLLAGGVPRVRIRPGRGIGPGSFEFYWSRNGTTDQLIRNPHSLYLQKLSELGLAGFVAIVVALAGLLWGAIEARRRWIHEADLAAGGGLFAAFVVFAVYAGVDWMWEMGAIGTLGHGRRRCRRCLAVSPGCPAQRLGACRSHLAGARRGGVPGAHPRLNRENTRQRQRPWLKATQRGGSSSPTTQSGPSPGPHLRTPKRRLRCWRRAG